MGLRWYYGEFWNFSMAVFLSDNFIEIFKFWAKIQIIFLSNELLFQFDKDFELLHPGKMDNFISKFPSLIPKIFKYSKMTMPSLLEKNFNRIKDGRLWNSLLFKIFGPFSNEINELIFFYQNRTELLLY